MSIWTDPEFQYRVKQLLIYSIEFIETDAQCYQESVTVDGKWMDELEKQTYESEMTKVAELERVLAEIDQDCRLGGFDVIGG